MSPNSLDCIEGPVEVVVEVTASPQIKRETHDKYPLQNRNIFADYGDRSLLHVVQMARIFPDSKTFVDMKVKENPNKVQMAFEDLMRTYENNPPRNVISDFVDSHFTMDDQMKECSLPDWNETPQFLGRIVDEKYRKFASDLNCRWKILSRKISDEVRVNPDLYTLIYLPNPVIVPGGRFREIYYWDSFWIIRGLLLCDMFDTVKGMLDNFAHMIKLYGKIPNGGRTYYINRSQPPLFIQMVNEYVKATGDTEYVREILPLMLREMNYWQQEHMVTVYKNGGEYQMARFNCEDPGPRPESYVEDYELANEHEGSMEDRARIYWEMKTGAETGWDYSSRWMIKDGENQGELYDTKARFIIPVDLNAFLALNAKILSDFVKVIQPDNFEEINRLNQFSTELVDAMDTILWDEEDGIWYDYDILNMTSRRYYTPSNLVPLWTESFSSSENRDKQTRASVAYLKRQNLGLFPGGVPTTYTQSGQQWDFPNCWPPLEHMLVQGLEKTDLDEARELAFAIAEKRIKGSFQNFNEKGHMFEKYDASSTTRIGGGGEYEIQIGFGWSNGVVLDFLDLYSTRLSSQRLEDKKMLETISAEEIFDDNIR